MSEHDDSPEGFPKSGIRLGGLSGGEHDSSLRSPDSAPSAGGAAPREADDQSLGLPRGALIAFRRSGGFRFSSRHCVVYRGGRVARGATDAELPPRYLSRGELRLVYLLILRARLGRFSGLRQRSAPDGYTYEIAARIGTHVHRLELQDGGIPKEIDPLLRVLGRMLR